MFPIQKIISVFTSYQEGQVIFPHGLVAWAVKTVKPPVQVWISEDAAIGQPVCQGARNFYSITLTEDGFTLDAQVGTESASVSWLANFEVDC